MTALAAELVDLGAGVVVTEGALDDPDVWAALADQTPPLTAIVHAGESDVAAWPLSSR